MDGFIVINKDAGMTSHDVVSVVRRIIGQKKVGHTGTLDPFATGVLPVALGEATKAIGFLDESVKEYLAVMKLGVSTDTQDLTGKIVKESPCNEISAATLQSVMESFTGKINQIPPMFSAVKHQGERLYALARNGEEVERKPRPIEIYSLKIEGISFPLVSFQVSCSRGTYVRTLASDMGDMLGCGAHLVELRRMRSGPFHALHALSLDELELRKKSGSVDSSVVKPYDALNHLEEIVLNETGARKIRNGVVPGSEDIAANKTFNQEMKVLFSREKRVLAVGEVILDQDNDAPRFRLLRVFN